MSESRLLIAIEFWSPLAAGKYPYGRSYETVTLCIIMIRRLKSGEYRLYSRKRNPATGKRRNLGTFSSLKAAKRHEKAVQFFKRT